jgi:hypothetical protein
MGEVVRKALALVGYQSERRGQLLAAVFVRVLGHGYILDCFECSGVAHGVLPVALICARLLSSGIGPCQAIAPGNAHPNWTSPSRPARAIVDARPVDRVSANFDPQPLKRIATAPAGYAMSVAASSPSCEAPATGRSLFVRYRLPGLCY